ncbi:hypothetical protein [Deinococcus aluminii]|uniref:Uncharacterized protein n=1 Tax=Deinococcus aluminii TaxID=1656885 RepID=A0ABP9XHS7_9DEIO
MPFQRVNAQGFRQFEQARPLLAALIEAGLLAALPPADGEDLLRYLQRLDGLPAPLEGGSALRLEWYANANEGHDGEEPRATHELMLSLVDDPDCIAHTCWDARRGLGQLHPLLLGSILAHLSAFTAHSWGVYTATDALFEADMTLYEGGPSAFWQDLHRELRAELGRTPTRAEVRDRARDRCIPPGELMRQIGLNETLPAVSDRLRLSPEAIQDLAKAHTGKWAQTTSEIAQALSTLRDIDARLVELGHPADEAARWGRGEMRRSPLCVISGQAEPTPSGHLHLTQEFLEEAWQLAAQDKGFYPTLTVRLLTPEDVTRAAEMVRLLWAAKRHVHRIVDLLAG